MKWFYSLVARLFGRNLRSMPPNLIVDQLNEARPLPMGLQDFEAWSDRIISGALIPGVHVESQKATLANCLLHLGPTESHKADAYFVHSLRKLAVNQVGAAMFQEYRDRTKRRLEEENNIVLNGKGGSSSV